MDGSGQLTGATGVNVNGTLYDVTFVTGTCASAFGSCSNSNFAFTNVTDSLAAANALLGQLFVDGTAGQFDSTPALTYGCGYPQICEALIPYQYGAGGLSVSYANNSNVEASDTTGWGGASDTFDFSYDFVWAKFAPEAVPEPTTWIMMLLGFSAIGAAVRRKRSRLPHLTSQ